MSTTALSGTLIASTVFQHWASGPGASTPTVYPGLASDTSGWSAWYEIWVDHWSARRQRQQAPELQDVRVTVHAFARPSADLAQVQELMRQARELLTGVTWPIADSDPAETLLGYLKLGEADIRELSRLDADASRHGLQHHVGQWSGLAMRELASVTA